MRMILTVHFPHEPFNSLVRSKEVGPLLGKILETLKPESAYFTEQNGTRGAILIVNVADPSQIPFYAEPFFLNFEADCEFRIAMTAEDLAKGNLDALATQWG